MPALSFVNTCRTKCAPVKLCHQQCHTGGRWQGEDNCNRSCRLYTLSFVLLRSIRLCVAGTYSPKPLLAVHRAFTRWSCARLAPPLLHPAAPSQALRHDLLLSHGVLFHAGLVACTGAEGLVCPTQRAPMFDHFICDSSMLRMEYKFSSRKGEGLSAGKASEMTRWPSQCIRTPLQEFCSTCPGNPLGSACPNEHAWRPS